METIRNKKQFALYIGLTAAIIIILNIAFRSLFVRIDLTKNNIYSLSKSSKKVLKNLEDPVTAKVFFSKNLPGKSGKTKRYLQDILEEYHAYSKGKFEFNFIDVSDKEGKQQARDYRIRPVQMQVLKNDQQKIRNVYMGMVLLYHNNSERLPVIKNTKGLEYDITTAMKKLSEQQRKTVGVLSSSSNKIKSSPQAISQAISKSYNIRRVNLNRNIPNGVDVLLLNGIQDSLPKNKIYRLDQFLMEGGKLFIGQSRVNDKLNSGQPKGELIQSNIFAFLEHYGLNVTKDLLIDKNSGKVQMMQQRGNFQMPIAIKYPPLMNITNMNKNHPIVEDIEQVQLMFANKLALSDSSVKFTPLLKTSHETGSIQPKKMRPSRRQMMMMQKTGRKAQMITGMGYNLQPNVAKLNMNNPAMNSFPLGPQVVSGIVHGRATSYFKGDTAFSNKKGFTKQTSDAEILLVTDNKIFNGKKQRGGRLKQNQDFILNSVDYLLGETSLIDLRSRKITSRPLDQLSSGQKQFWKWLNILLPSLLVLIYGAYRMKRNKDKQKILEELYG